MQPTATIPHPTRQGEWIRFHMLSRHEQETARNDSYNDSVYPAAIKDMDTGLPIRTIDGVASKVMGRVGVSDAMYALSDAMDAWNIEDEDGKPVAFEPDKRARRRMIHFLGEELYDVKMDGLKNAAGESVPMLSFLAYLKPLVEKRETFIPNSSAPASSTL